MKKKIERSELILILISTLVTLLLAMLVIRWIQPSLLGIADDLVLVQSSEEIPPFYELVFDEKSLAIDPVDVSDPESERRRGGVWRPRLER